MVQTAGPCKTCIKLRKAAFAVIRTVLPKPKPVDENVLRTQYDDIAPHKQ